MQFLTMMSLISITVPGITLLIQGVLLNFVQLDILQTDKWLIPMIFGEDDNSILDQPLNPYFDENGFGKISFLKNLGSALVFTTLFPLAFLSIYILRLSSRLFKKESSHFKKIWTLSVKLENKLMWDYSLRFLLG